MLALVKAGQAFHMVGCCSGMFIMLLTSDSMSELKVIDSHVHLGRWGKQTIDGRAIDPFKGKELDSFEKIKEFVNKHNIDRVVIIPIYSLNPSAAFQTDSNIIEYGQQGKGKIVPGFWVGP